MADLIARLDDLDERRTKILTYKNRVRLAGYIMPQTARRLIDGFDERFQRLTVERRQVLELIRANPILRKRLYDREQAALKANPQREEDRG